MRIVQGEEADVGMTVPMISLDIVYRPIGYDPCCRLVAVDDTLLPCIPGLFSFDL